MDVSLLIRQRLSELGVGQKDLAAAAHVTESYISQLLARKKSPPAPERTGIYERIGEFLQLPSGELAKLADDQRLQTLKKRVSELPSPLLPELRELILGKCHANRRPEIRPIFERDAFGELERLVTQCLLSVAQSVVKNGLFRDEWVGYLAGLLGAEEEATRALALEFLSAEVFDGTRESCLTLFRHTIDSWDIDLKTFRLEVVLNERLTHSVVRRFEFAEQAAVDGPPALEPGFQQFLSDRSLSADATEEELRFLAQLRFRERRPSAFYFYRELQSLRDPLHFPPPEAGRSDRQSI